MSISKRGACAASCVGEAVSGEATCAARVGEAMAAARGGETGGDTTPAAPRAAVLVSDALRRGTTSLALVSCVVNAEYERGG